MKQLLSTCVMVFEFLRSAECRIWLRLTLKPLAVLATLALFLWLGAWFDSQLANHVAQAQSQQFACPPGTEQFGDRCYPPCAPGNVPSTITAECLKPCPVLPKLLFPKSVSKPIPGSNLCQIEPILYTTDRYVRLPFRVQGCLPNQVKEGGLCYFQCRDGFYALATTCWQKCPGGYIDDGAFCRRPSPLHIFPKQSHGRGVGTEPQGCSSSQEAINGNCYLRCDSGETPVGLTCLKKCESGYIPFRQDTDLCFSISPPQPRPSSSRGAGVPLNAIPLAKDTTVSTPRNKPVTFQPVALDADAADVPNLQFTFGSFSNGTHSVVNGANVYTPKTGFAGVDIIRWTVFDGKHRSDTAFVTILVGTVAPNNAPVAIDRTVAVTEDTPITITVTCTDAENDELFYQLRDTPQHGDFQWLPPNTVVYTPTANFVGTDSFTFQSHDGREASNISTITLTVAAVNDAPLAESQTITTVRNAGTIVNLSATDVESDTLHYSLVSSPTHGALYGEIPTLGYRPDRPFVGNDSFQFQVSDENGAASVATINITVLPTNTAPLAESLVLTTEQESAQAVNLSASDADGDPLTYTLVASPTNGVLSGDGAELIYTPNTGFIGTDSFTFKSNDGQADSPVTTVTIHVTAAPNEASVAGIVYEDRNGNGQPDGEDVGVPGLLVTLTPASARAGEVFSTITEAGGGWRIDEVPFGSYTVKVTGGTGVQIEQLVAASLTVGQRGLQQLQPGAVKVTSRALFLPVVVR